MQKMAELVSRTNRKARLRRLGKRRSGHRTRVAFIQIQMEWAAGFILKMQPHNPLHGITLEKLLTELVETYGWEELAKQININCFKSDPSIKSSLKFLRRTPWAREKVENLYVATIEK